MTDAIAAMGVILKLGSTVIASITNLDAGETTLDTKDVTTLDSPNDFREFKGTLLDGGEMTLEFNYIAGNAGQVALRAAQLDKESHEFTLIWPSEVDAEVIFDALVTKIGRPKFAPDGTVSGGATLKVTGFFDIDEGESDGLTTDYFTISESAVVSPAPAAAKYDYIASVLTGVTSVTVTPHGTGVLRVNGAIVATGEASTAILLGAAGSINDIVITQKDTGKVAKTYNIKLFRAAS